MEVFHTIAQAAAGAPAAVACGYFDGLHIGHAAVVGRAVQRAKEEGLCAGVFTCTRAGGSPERKAGAGEIVTEADKYAILDAWGVQRVLAPDFSEFHNLEPEEFFDGVLVRRMGARVVCCGADFRFGRAAAGGAAGGRLGERFRARGGRAGRPPRGRGDEVRRGGQQARSAGRHR